MLFSLQEDTMVMGEKEIAMRHLLELKKQIEIIRKELNISAKKGLDREECYKISIQLDGLIADYMQLKKEEI